MSEINNLLNIAKGTVSGKVKPKNYTQVEKFIKDHKIEAADKPQVESLRVWLLYKKWRKKNRMTLTAFFREFRNYFKKVRRTEGWFFYIKSPYFDLSDKGYWNYRAALRNYKYNEKRVKTRKKNAQKSK
jgi:hypothetical protein